MQNEKGELPEVQAFQFNRQYELELLIPFEFYEKFQDLEYYKARVRERNMRKLVALYKQAVIAKKNHFGKDEHGENILWDAECENRLANMVAFLTSENLI